MSRFLERLAEGPPIVGDGGMGTLISSAVARLRCPEEANLRAPESVLSLHLGFIRAGAELIETNTFGANRRKLAEHYLEDDVAAINEAAVKIARDAREVSGRDVFVAGSIGPLGGPVKDREAAFAEQAQLLEGRGVDLFMIETFYDLDELVTAIATVRKASALPIVALLTFDEDAQTLGGVSAEQASAALAELDVAAIGANHGVGLQAALRAIERMGGQEKPLAALPNVGLASLAGERIIFPHATPEYFAEFAAHARELGARIVGGCCGTTPTEIAAIRRAIDEQRNPSAPLVMREREIVVTASEPERETLLQQKLRTGEFVVSVEIDPPRGGNAHAMLELARTLKESGHVDVVDVNDNPRARARMSGLIASATIERVVGLETIPHVTPRDSSIAGLESLLLGAHAEGIRNVLAVTGDPPEAGDYPGARGVYEVDSIGLSQVITRMNAGEDFNGREIDAPTSFFLGVAVNPAAEDLDFELERFQKKLEAGAQFAMTQVLFDLSFLDEFLRRLGGSCPIPLLVGIFYVRSYQLALRLHNEVPGIIVPERVQARLKDAGPNAADTGLAIARELFEASRERAAGVYVIPPFRQPHAALDLFS
ncbi:MAG: bifunctional homocysteine S-methyltransferase/methylenetetrahydrofolate reductase [Thermoleophilia bacterium]|nr:bifunctional homocysteine S-methyltransferase/methylenetetrahydrofolate reductase [Thermoleophilia bacterium]MDH4339729.1 bifunctional homocysteine S-methyltransferase/methylenetetrahydrofolate reductase [Thermoleophilia bacterium]MDH5280397.1 bifunctional homocysteine S-methyltransferase/methylenetetrahydrofolate reductase [Thermoleophilia bacterium]